MHFLMFHMKRAHLSSVKAARDFCAELELTPARFDLMRAVSGSAIGRTQRQLSKDLGLSRQTVSMMVRRLIELGLLTRAWSPRDGRTFDVMLTKEGERRMHRAYSRIGRERPFQLRYERAFGEWSPTTADAVQNLNWALRVSAQHLGDTAGGFYRSKDPE